MIAQRTSGRPKRARGTAMRRSQASAISSPPARAKPLIAAIVGFHRQYSGGRDGDHQQR
jgi:hypothetical protein